MELMAVSKNKISKTFLLIDSLIIMLNLSASYSILPYIVFHQYHRFINSIIIVFIDVIYVYARFHRVYIIKREPLFYIFVVLNLVNLIAAYITDTGWYASLAYLVLNTVFYFVLYNIYINYSKRIGADDVFRLIFRGYLWLVFIALLSSLSLFTLASLGFNLHTNPVDTDYDLFKTNFEELGSSHFFPYYLGVLVDTFDIRIPFFQEQGIITGLYHEAHIVTFMTFPCLPLILYYIKNNWIRLFLSCCFVLILLLAGSTTNIIAVFGCFLIYILYRFKTNFIKAVPFLLIIILAFFVIISSVDLSLFQFVFDKMDSSSAGYTQTTLEFAVTPKDIIGTSIYDETEVTSHGNMGNRDVGFLVFFLNIFFLIGCFIYLFKLFRAKSNMKLAYLLFASYFFIHSTKVAMVTYSLTMLTFVVFCISHLSRTPDQELKK